MALANASWDAVVGGRDADGFRVRLRVAFRGRVRMASGWLLFGRSRLRRHCWPIAPRSL